MAAHNKSKNPLEIPRQASLALLIVNRYIKWILLLLVGVTLLLGYIFVIDKQMTELRDVARQSLSAKEKILSDLKIIKQDLDQIVIEFAAIRTRKKAVFDQLNRLLPATSEYADLYTVLDDLTRRSGLIMTSINIALNEPSRSKTQSGFSSGGEQKSAAPAGPYKTITLSLAVEGGTYDTLKNYLTAIERSSRLFDVQSISFDGGAFRGDEDGALGTPHYDIELTTYYLADPNAQ